LLPCSLLFCSLFVRDHVDLDPCQPAAVHFPHLEARAHTERCRRTRKHVERHARIHKRAQQHVAANPGKAFQIADSHRFVIVNDLL
jgi:hypothetical protein